MERYKSLREKWKTEYKDKGNGKKTPVRYDDADDKDKEDDDRGDF